MAIDIHRLANGKAEEYLLSIDETELLSLGLALEALTAKTGLSINPYKDTKLNSGLKHFIDALNNHDNGSDIFSKLIAELKLANSSGYGIILLGD